ncbi:MAG: dTDP-glucose 4,6-dehydratase [Bernardetiaceae bacterium]
MKHILVTGGAGFIGANFIPYFLEQHQGYRLINLDALTYAGDLSKLKSVEHHPRYVFVEGDIQNRDLVQFLFAQYDIRGVVHLAAESHVDNSIAGPEAFVRTNVLGTFTLLDVARKHWMSAPFVHREGYQEARFLHVSTDEVYGSLGPEGAFTETTPYAPNSPYSASKASSDMIVRSYHHTYGMNTVTTNCSNNFGPKQHPEKLIPVVIGKALQEQPIPVYGDGQNIRDWLYVLDHARGIDAAFHRGRSGETYNIGSRNEKNNLQLVRHICQQLDTLRPRPNGKSHQELITFVKDRPGHDRRYAIDPTKIETELGWKPAADFETALTQTLRWYMDYFQPNQQVEEKTTPTPTPPAPEIIEDRFAQTLEAQDLHQALEGLAQIEADLIKTRKEYETHTQQAKDWEAKAFQLLQRAQQQAIPMSQADTLATQILKEQQKAQHQAQQSFQTISELERLKVRMQENIQRIKASKEQAHQKAVQMPDSSETIALIERMKQKILKNEILGDLYAQQITEDPLLDQKVNEALGMDPKKEALEKFKAEKGYK